MPDRPGVDDNEQLAELIDVWRNAHDELQDRKDDVASRIRELDGRIGSDANTRRRLVLQRERLEELEQVAVSIASDLEVKTAEFIESGGVANIYAAGAAAQPFAFSWVLPHQEAVRVLSQDLFDDLLVATAHIGGDAKQFVRRIGRQLTVEKLTGGRTAVQQGRSFARALAREVELKKIGGVTYRNGAVHPFGAYAEMLLRSKSAIAYNSGALNSGRLAGIEFYELLDGSACGLFAHSDPPLANNLVVDYQTAMNYPISHPSCRRSVVARPDLNRESDLSGVVSVQSEGAREDQAAFERALVSQQRGRGSRRARRPRRVRRSSR